MDYTKIIIESVITVGMLGGVLWTLLYPIKRDVSNMRENGEKRKQENALQFTLSLNNQKFLKLLYKKLDGQHINGELEDAYKSLEKLSDVVEQHLINNQD